LEMAHLKYSTVKIYTARTQWLSRTFEVIIQNQSIGSLLIAKILIKCLE
jgi:hypothetical protein